MKHPLRNSILKITIPIVLILCFALAFVGFQINRNDLIRRYQNYAGDAIEFLARCVDGDDLQTCIETQEKSEKYNELQVLSNNLKESYDLEYVYIIVPLKAAPPDNMMDVMAAVTEYELTEEADQLTDLGNLTGDDYPEDVAKKYLERMDHDPTITYFLNSTNFGNVYTAIRPLFNSDGDPIAVICADTMVREMSQSVLQYAISAGIFALVFSILIIILINLWFNRRIVVPIAKLEKSARSFEEKCRERADLEDLVMDDPDIHTGDEIEELSNSISSMVHDVRGYAQDLLDKEKELHRVDQLAHKDALTNVKNRNAFNEMVQKLKDENNRHFGVVMVDLDHLKLVNDEQGHDHGDEYIVGVCKMVCNAFAHSPVYRIGGDEFIVIVQNHDYDNREQIVEDLRQQFEACRNDSEKELWQRYSAAVGLSIFEEGDTVDSVFERADKIMYEEKKRRAVAR